MVTVGPVRAHLAILGLVITGCDLSDPVRFRPIAPCPQVFSAPVTYRVDASCRPSDCEVEVQQQECEAQLHFRASERAPPGFEGCALDVGRWPIAADGRLQDPKLPPLEGCRLSPPRAGVAHAFECTSCTVELYPPPSPLELPLQTLELLGPIVPDQISNALGIELEGRASAMVIRGPLAFISTFPWSVDGACRDVPGTLAVVDLESFVPLPSRPAPPCLLLLEAAPNEAGFYGVFRSSDWRLGRFDAQGQLVAEWPLPAMLEGEVYWEDLLAFDGFLFLVGNEVGPKGLTGVLLRIDPSANGATERLGPGPIPEAFSFLGPGFGGELVVGNTETDRLQPIDPSTLIRGLSLPVPSERDNDSRAGRLYPLPNGVLLHLGPYQFEPAAFTIFANRQVVAEVGYWEAPAGGLGAVHLPGSPEVWIGLTTLLDNEARLARLDLTERRFRPGSAVLGRGPVTHLVAHQGALIGLLPWTATLFRVVPSR
jgi:hypothetical protein